MSPQPRVVVVGEPAEAGLGGSLVSAFRTRGCLVDVLDWGPWSPAWLVSAAFRQPFLGAAYRREFRQRVDISAENGSADLVLVVKGALLDRRSIEHLRLRFDAPVVCWNPDSPFDGAISNSGGGIPRAIGAYDAYITWAEDVAEQLSRVAARVLVVPFAWDPDVIRPARGGGIAAGRIAFIGTGTRERSALLRELSHLRPIVFGERWPEIEGVDIRPPVRRSEFSRVAGEARWNLNLLRRQNSRSHNMRTFELVGADGAQVAPETPDHRRFLSQDSRTVLYRGKNELESILRSDPSERPPRIPDLLEGHTYADRADQVLTELRISGRVVEV